MVKQVTTCFEVMDEAADEAPFLAEHQEQFPGNLLAVWHRTDGKKVVKVAHPDGYVHDGSTEWMTREEFHAHMAANPALYGIEEPEA